MAKAPLPGGLDAGAMEVPAIFSNHVQISRLGTTLVRMSFAEAPAPDSPTYRAAILMTLEDVRGFAAGLQQLLNAPMPPPASRPG